MNYVNGVHLSHHITKHWYFWMLVYRNDNTIEAYHYMPAKKTKPYTLAEGEQEAELSNVQLPETVCRAVLSGYSVVQVEGAGDLQFVMLPPGVDKWTPSK